MKIEPFVQYPGAVIREKEADAEGYHLSYALCRSDFSVRGERIYSLAVTISSGRDRETACAYDLTHSRSRALSIFEIVSRGLVTPCTLFDVLEDLL